MCSHTLSFRKIKFNIVPFWGSVVAQMLKLVSLNDLAELSLSAWIRILTKLSWYFFLSLLY